MKSRCNSLTRIFKLWFQVLLGARAFVQSSRTRGCCAFRSQVTSGSTPSRTDFHHRCFFYQSEIWKPHLYFSDTCELLQMLSVISRLSSPDVVPAALLLPLSALCCLLLPGQCHWSVSGSPLPLQRLLWSHLGGPAAAPPRPVRHTHTDVLNWF